MALTMNELLASAIALKDTLVAKSNRTGEENQMLAVLREKIAQARGVDAPIGDIQESLEDAYDVILDTAGLTTWPSGDAGKLLEEKVGAAFIRLQQNRSVMVETATKASQPTEQRLKAKLRDFADGTVAIAPVTLREQCCEWLESWFDAVVDRPSEAVVLADLATIDQITTSTELAIALNRMMEPARRILARRERRGQ